jgi:O-antigen ligase
MRKTPAAMPPPLSADVLVKSDQSTVERLQLWRVAFRMFRAHPITGVGPDGFRNLYGPYAGVQEWNRNIYTNNTYIEMFVNLGILGGMAFLWLGGLGLWLATRNILREPPDGKWALGLGATAAVVAFFFHGLGDYFLFSTPLYILFWLLLAVSALWPRMLRAT